VRARGRPESAVNINVNTVAARVAGLIYCSPGLPYFETQGSCDSKKQPQPGLQILVAAPPFANPFEALPTEPFCMSVKMVPPFGFRAVLLLPKVLHRH
jgi:hypothetical protein